MSLYVSLAVLCVLLSADDAIRSQRIHRRSAVELCEPLGLAILSRFVLVCFRHWPLLFPVLRFPFLTTVMTNRV